MVVKFPCEICNKAIANNNRVLHCDNCHLSFHIKCNRINLQTYKYLPRCSSAWYSLKCCEELIPFTTVSNKELYQTNRGQQIKFTTVAKMVSSFQDIINQLMMQWMILCLTIYQLNTMSHTNLHSNEKYNTHFVFLSFKYIFPLLSHRGTDHCYI